MFAFRKWPLVPVLLAGALAVTQAACARDRDDHGRIDHVFIIVLENEGFDITFGPNSPAKFLSETLPKKGVLLTQYFATGHVSLDNYIAMISGQGATPQTRNDCKTYQDFSLKGIAPDGQAIGSGCVYPAQIKTLADQLTAAGKTWHGYMEDMGNDPSREAPTCGRPALDSADRTQAAEAPSPAVPSGDQYASRHDPFVYFHSIIDQPGCDANVVNLDRLPQDLAAAATTPNLVFITPNLCNDGHDAPCKNGQPGGLVSADQFLQKWVPMIMASPAFKRDGLLIVTFDEAELEAAQVNGKTVLSAPGASCCNEQPGPNLGPFPQNTTLGSATLSFASFGGDRIGAVLLSPFLTPGTVSNTPFNHYSMLKTVEDIFGLGHLGFAGAPGLRGFFGCAGSDVPSRSDDQFRLCERD